MKEGIEITLTNKKLRINRDEGRDLSPEWFSILKKIQHRRLHRSLIMYVSHHSARIIVPGATDRSDRRTFFLKLFCFVFFFFSFFALMMTG